MTAAICKVCGLPSHDIKNVVLTLNCTMTGYEREKARAEAAERERDEARSVGLENYERVRSERAALRAERDALKGEIASAYKAAGWEPQHGALADRMSGVIAAFRDSAELDAIRAEAAAGGDDPMLIANGCDVGGISRRLIVAAITHERTIAAQQRRELIKALRGVEKMSDEREGMGFIERLFRCGQIARAALAAVGSP